MMRSSLVIVLGFVLAACGGDDGGSKESANTGKGAAGKSAGGKSKPCGSKMCTLPSELKDEEPCCRDNFNSECGVQAGATCRALPDVDERCPVPAIMANFPGAMSMKAFGCCTGAGECGIDFGMGCQPRTIACMAVSPENAKSIKPQKCTGEELPLPADCGMGGFRIPNFAGSGG
ncbi:MAG TPA: hypothetical protein VJR89_28870 [Polyangiales bacterium]|nr:hypothetical protein [Polyangiales bacterium]